jgi:hypothetical protein
MNPEDPFVTAISRWLAGHADDAELLGQLQGQTKDGLAPEQSDAVRELVEALSGPDPKHAQLQMVARETLEALALGS